MDQRNKEEEQKTDTPRQTEQKSVAIFIPLNRRSALKKFHHACSFLLVIPEGQRFQSAQFRLFGGNAVVHIQHNAIIKYYGTYTSKVNDLDEDLLDVTISAPTRIVMSNDQTYWLDTDNWTEAMGKIVVPPAGFDTTTGTPIADPDAKPWTAEQYLASKAFADVTIQANQKTSSSDYVELSFPKN